MEIESFVKELLSHFDFAYMLIVNIVTYLVIKVIDNLNGDKAVPTWGKRTVSVISGIALGCAACYLGGDKITLFYSFFVSLVSWDIIFKPLLKKLGDKIDYKKDAK